MAFKLSKSEDDKLVELKGAVSDAFQKLETSIDAYNGTLTRSQDEVIGKLNTYNETLSELHQFVEGVATKRREELDEKSDNWLEGESGQAAVDWIDIWEGVDLEEVSIAFPEEVVLDFENHGDIDLPSEP
jgi:oligoendopeptidase F